MAELIPALPEQLYTALQREKFVLLNSAFILIEPESPNLYDIRAAEQADGQVLMRKKP
ncbi:hypothetical protein GK047_04325 [Paenibacillus sp. SYP-B3998]|uniref:Uncharacterized protein n=1 Tax=Paenibacillus sp. SYP-B3998 TaxID=2678564 RepID=A0A6G3ZSQ6_9BACL|nr:hypothetical protein [Paenibacillus sp. SYP-B3998]NEW05246.1 hypothetical protein [Paenibacillus sp. SYP-B3998]